jgi:hypothetical protein
MRTNLDIQALAREHNDMFRATSHLQLAVSYSKVTELMNESTREQFDSLLLFSPTKRSLYRAIGRQEAWINELREQLPVDLTHLYAIARAGENFARTCVEQGLLHPDIKRTELNALIKACAPKPAPKKTDKQQFVQYALIKLPSDPSPELIAHVNSALHTLMQSGADCEYTQAGSDQERSIRSATISLAKARVADIRMRHLLTKPPKTRVDSWLERCGFDEAALKLTSKASFSDIERVLQLARDDCSVNDLKAQAESILKIEHPDVDLSQLLARSEA